MSRFDGKVAIITGAASGIGKEIALRFAAEGGTPVIADLNLDAADATAREIKANGPDAFAVGMNVADEAAVEKGVADTMAKYGRIDVLVSNAGIQIVKPIVDFPFADWKRLLAIHLDGAFLMTRACLKHMYEAKSGSIVYMGSVHSKEASVLKAPYVTWDCAGWSPKKAPSTMCAPMWFVRGLCARRWSTSRSPSRPKSSASAKRT
jgi:3-hydroxybutyrate dehydrogenase